MLGVVGKGSTSSPGKKKTCYLRPRLARRCTVVLVMSGNCAVSSLRNREVSTIEGALTHTGIGSCIWDFINCNGGSRMGHLGKIPPLPSVEEP